jgi:hypothetical protein
MLVAPPLRAPRCEAIQCPEHTTAGRMAPARTRINPVSLIASTDTSRGRSQRSLLVSVETTLCTDSASGCLGTSRGSSSTTTPTRARLGASAPLAARRGARRRLLRLRRASGCLGTSHGSSRGSSPTTAPIPHV